MNSQLDLRFRPQARIPRLANICVVYVTKWASELLLFIYTEFIYNTALRHFAPRVKKQDGFPTPLHIRKSGRLAIQTIFLSSTKAMSSHTFGTADQVNAALSSKREEQSENSTGTSGRMSGLLSTSVWVVASVYLSAESALRSIKEISSTWEGWCWILDV